MSGLLSRIGTSEKRPPFAALLLAGGLLACLAGCENRSVSTAVADEPQPQVDAAVLAGLQQDVEQARAVWEVPGAAVVVVAHDHVLFTQGFGFRNLEREQPVTARTLFRVSAATSALTSTLIGTLVDDNELEWDTTAGELSPDLARELGDLELADLMSRPESDAEAAVTAVEPPYARLAFAAAAGQGGVDAGGEKSGFHHLMQRKIFGPAGMTMTALGNQLPAMSEDYATPYHRDELGRLTSLSFPDLESDHHVGVASTAHDMARFLILHIQGGIAQSGKRVASPTNLAETRAPRRPLEESARALWPLAGKAGRGMGWVRFELPWNGQQFDGLNGGGEGFSVQLGFLEKSGIGLVVLNNKDPSSGGVAFNAEVRDRLLARLYHADYPPPVSAR